MKKTSLLVAVVAMALFAVVAAASAGTEVFPGAGSPNSTASNTTTPTVVRATINPKITLTIQCPDATQTVDFGNVDPGTVYSKDVTLTVQSNKQWTITSVPSDIIAGSGTALNLVTDVPATAWNGVQARTTNAGVTTADTFQITPTYDTTAGAYAIQVLYTVTQQ